MKNLQKGFIVPVLVAIIALLVIGGGVYIYKNKKVEVPAVVDNGTQQINTQTPTPQQPSPTPVNETANWKTYKNDTYSFEVKYPSDWTAKGSWSENGGFFYVAFGTANSIDSKPLATLRVYPNQTTLDKFVKYFDYIGGTWKDTTLNGVSAKEVVSTGQNSQQFILIASVKNSYGYELASTAFGNNVDTIRKMGSTFKFLNQNSLSAKISNVLPSGSIFTQGEGAMIPLSWSIVNPPASATIYLDLLSSDGSESLGRITNNPDCSKGGDTISLATSVKSYKWDGLYVCSNWQAHSVNPGSYKIGVSLYSANGTTIVASGQSNTSFTLQK